MESKLNSLITEGTLWFAEKGAVDYAPKPSRLTANFGISDIDRSFSDGGLIFGAVHELFLSDGINQNRRSWNPPLILSTLFIRNALEGRPREAPSGSLSKIILWIGRRCWPTPYLLEKNWGRIFDWQQRCFFIDPADKNDRLWSISKALSSPAVYAVIADASGFNFTAVRRLQLAAKRSQALGLLLRPPNEALKTICASRTRWLIEPSVNQPSGKCTPGIREPVSQRWQLTILKAPGLASQKQWVVELANEGDHLGLIPEIRDELGQEADFADGQQTSRALKRSAGSS